jgi:hypothetical protein
MSISQSVAFKRTKLPTTAAISDAARSLGFDLVIDETDLAKHTGFLPAQLNGAAAGFEWMLDNPDDYGEIGIDFGDRDCVACLVTHSDEAECQSAMIAAAVILSLTGGIYFDDYDNVETSPDRLLSEVREWLDGVQ